MIHYSYDYRIPESYDRRKLAEAENILALLAEFRRVVDSMEKRWVELSAAQDDSLTTLRASVYLPGTFEVLNRVGAYRIFWGILQQYKISSSADRKLIEQASKEFSKNRIQRVKPDVALEVLKKKVDTYRSYADAADRVIKKGELHNDEASGTTETAGCFTLVNTGDFSAQQMADVAKVVDRASALIKAKGFGKICYGTIQVTNTVNRSSNVLAFYVARTDEFFVRGNLKGKQGPAISTIIHELGHRLHLKFLKSKDAEIETLYKTLLNGDETAFREALNDKANWPKPGDLHKDKDGKVYEVEKVVLNRAYDWVVQVHLKEEPTIKASISLSGWINVKGLKKETFVSPYARTSYVENFAEMFDHYVEETLPDGQVQMLEAVIK